jgi:hypothetical protein
VRRAARGQRPGEHTGARDREDRAKHTLRRRHRPEVGEESLHLVEDLVRIDGHEVIRARQLDEPRSGDVLGEVAALLAATVLIALAVHDERRHLNR